MINTIRLLKVGSAWTTSIYVICFGGVALFPGIRETFMRYALHMNVDAGANVLTIGTFVTGLIIWNLVAIVSLGIFAGLWNSIKK